MTELKQTKGSVRIEGKIVGFSTDGSYREGSTKEKGNPYRSISLNIKTSNNNVIYSVDLFGQVPDKKVKVYSNKNGERQQLEINFSERKDIPEGFTCFGFGTAGIALVKEDDGKAKLHNYFNYDAVELIKNNVENNLEVWVDAQFKIEKYQSNGEDKTSVKYTIEKIGLKNASDFDDEKFVEVSSFEHDIVVMNTNVNKEKKKLYVSGRIIQFNKTFSDMVFTVDAEKYDKLANNIATKAKTGDILPIQGKCVNGTILVDAPKKVDWGGESPEGVGKVNGGSISEFQITKVINHQAKVYRSEDFIVANPFQRDDGKPIDISEDDLSL
ncbi:hypothetical protein [Paenibacillus sp. FSL H7-0331]|uniref:hypothetical protein n=1 Tax=Paenibacillus sp. FSL H7-0331 TaxID=1920421 RepID=UPI00096DC84E|nr:hypothetical protein [Paenibacillus sp. FSL H7-0331]OMF19836.1 hypothetical protein BK127_02705 [Paenibacillus sp. FSL H7-0331]